MRTTPQIGIVAALLFGAIIVLGNQAYPKLVASTEHASTQPAATSSVALIPALTEKALTLESQPATNTQTLQQSVESQTSPTTDSTSASTQTMPVKAGAITNPVPAPATTPEAATSFSFDSAASTLRGALVNIICYAPAGSGLHSSSGSGVIIDPRGIILTNAHVAAPFLLTNKGVSCVIRTGSPAQDSYTAKLMFISPTWVSDNAALFGTENPSGTGEYDYALLAIIGSATSAQNSSSFPAVPLSQQAPSVGNGVAIASYAAQFLDSSQIQSGLFPTVVFGSVKDVFTFGTSSVDVVALGGSAAAQEGSSGGGVVNESSNLIGIITTSTVTGDTSTRNVNAITATYIRRVYQNETGSTFSSLVSQNPTMAAAAFSSQIPGLEATILANLSH